MKAGQLVFLSGVLGNTATNSGDVSAQTKEIFTRIDRTLAAGVGFSDVVDNVVYLPDLWNRKHVDEIQRQFFPADPPARTLVGASRRTPRPHRNDDDRGRAMRRRRPPGHLKS